MARVGETSIARSGKQNIAFTEYLRFLQRRLHRHGPVSPEIRHAMLK